jgi:polysaccharide deacetylase family sporulation protein PdaB
MKPCLILTRKSILIVGAICLSLIFALIIFSTADIFVATSATQRRLPIYSTQKEEKVISFSFDAAWGAEDTQTLIDIFNQYNIKVTFFVVGDWVDKFPDKVKMLHDAGHEIQNHSDSHPHLTNLSKEEIVKELEACNQKIEKITGVRPTLMRPPYGDYDNKVIEATESIGMYTIQWSVDSLDWKDLSAQEIKTRVLSATEAGSIVLFHNAAKHTPEALPALIEALQKDGYQFVPISKLIYTENYTIDHTGKQIPNGTTKKGGE